MLVYGDPWRTIDLARWRARAAAPIAGARWVDRHAEIVAQLIETGQILQALEDEAFARDGEQDHGDPRLSPLRRWLVALARALILSFERAPVLPELGPPPDWPADMPSTIRAREPEGYAFYALYPEAYAAAARRLAASPQALVIGLRSIGSSLAPVVAAALGAADFVTLRPSGPPFAREINAPALAAALAAAPPRDVVIVDEGPGLSGSSFASVARFVRQAAPGSRLSFLPSHAGRPGAQASPETRELFASVPSVAAPMDRELPALLPGWVADLTGAALAPLEDLSGGAWRSRFYASEADWPASDVTQERLKFLLRAERGVFLLKFVGLGDIGARKARLAARLGAAGLAPEAHGYRHGFLVERWRDDARPLDPVRDRAALLPALARYLSFRRKHFVCADAFGATPDELRRMTARNVSLALDDAAVQRADAMTASICESGRPWRRVATDNRMQTHEWLIAPDGHVLKTDGVDHHAGHDLIGAQDVAYDIAAATIEFDLAPRETQQLCHEIARLTDAALPEDCVAPLRIVWLAFEIGRATLAESACGAGAEAKRLARRRSLLTAKLKHELDERPRSPNRELQSHTLVWPT